MGYDIVGVGLSSVDYIAMIPGAPGPDMKIEMTRFAVQGSGSAATATVACARMGLSACLFARLGDDTMGHYQRNELLREGVDVSHIPMEEGGTSPFAFVLVEEHTHRRTVVYHPGDLAPLREQELDRDAIATSGCLLLDPYQVIAGVRAASFAREASVPVLLHAEDVIDGVSQLVPMTDFLVGHIDFAKDFADTRSAKKAVDFLLSFGPRVVLLITEERGCLCATRTERFEVPPLSGELVDTTGSHDVFQGAVALGVLRGWDLKRIAEFATTAAGMKCAFLGAREGIPRLAEIERFLLHQGAAGRG